MHLNGWQRLWAVVAVVWTLVVLSFTVIVRPTTATVSKDKVFARMSAVNGRTLVDFPDPTVDAVGFIPDKGATVDIGGHVVQFAAGVTKADMERTAEDYYANLQRALTEERTQFAAVAAAYSLLPPIALYMLGWAIAWIRRGFSEKRA